MTAGAMSSGLNCFWMSATWVASAPLGSQAELSFFSTSPSLPASGPRTTSTATHSAATIHFDHRPHTSLAIPPEAIPPSPPETLSPADGRRVCRARPAPQAGSRHAQGYLREGPEVSVGIGQHTARGTGMIERVTNWEYARLE